MTARLAAVGRHPPHGHVPPAEPGPTVRTACRRWTSCSCATSSSTSTCATKIEVLQRDGAGAAPRRLPLPRRSRDDLRHQTSHSSGCTSARPSCYRLDRRQGGDDEARSHADDRGDRQDRSGRRSSTCRSSPAARPDRATTRRSRASCNIDGAWQGAVLVRCPLALASLVTAAMFQGDDDPTLRRRPRRAGRADEHGGRQREGAPSASPAPSRSRRSPSARTTRSAWWARDSSPPCRSRAKSSARGVGRAALGRRRREGDDDRGATPRRADPAVTTILVVDDSTAIRRIIGRTLTAAGYRVVEAADGRGRSRRVGPSTPISCCSTSTCPSWTAPPPCAR